jgi:hypothetical protein
MKRKTLVGIAIALLVATVLVTGLVLATTRTMRFGGHSWTVLNRDWRGGTAYIISKDVIGNVAYSDTGDYSWKDSTLRRFLEAFYFNSFSDRERRRIVIDRTEEEYDVHNLWLLFPDDRTKLRTDDMIARFGNNPSSWFLRPIMSYETQLPSQIQIVNASGEMQTVHDLRQTYGVRVVLTIKLY